MRIAHDENGAPVPVADFDLDTQNQDFDLTLFHPIAAEELSDLSERDLDAAMPTRDGVRFTGEIGGLQRSGTHAIHIHEKGNCSAADATSAGGHFNPVQQPHGRAGSGPHHGGDMDNLVADANGVARVDVRALGVTLGGGAPNDIAGRAVIVHAKADDYQTQPTGNAGARVACGVIAVQP